MTEVNVSGSAEITRELLVNWWKAIEESNPKAMVDFYSEDAIHQDLGLGKLLRGRGDILTFFDDFCTKMPDTMHLKSLQPGPTGYGMTWEFRGVHDRDWEGLPATGKSFVVEGGSVGEVVNGKIVFNQDYFNLASLLQQIGVLNLGQ